MAAIQRLMHAPCRPHPLCRQVEFPDGRRTLCLLPAKFHKTVWVKRGNFLIIESLEDTEAAVTGQILHVLFAADVKQLKKLEGVWPSEFVDADASGSVAVSEPEPEAETQGADGADAIVESLGGLSIGASDAKEDADRSSSSSSSSSSDDGLPPLARIQNRKIIEYDVSDSDSD